MDATDWSACDSGRSFAAIDFETATSQRSSACAVGVVIFNEGSAVDTRRLLIRPPGNRYDPFNTALHGIGPADTGHSPPFPEVWDQHASRTSRAARIPPRSLRSERLPPLLQRPAVSARILMLAQRQGLHSPRRARPRRCAVRHQDRLHRHPGVHAPARSIPSSSRCGSRAHRISQHAHRLSRGRNNRPAQSRRNGAERQAPQGPRSRHRRKPDPNHRRRPIRLPPRRNSHPRLPRPNSRRREPTPHHDLRSSRETARNPRRITARKPGRFNQRRRLDVLAAGFSVR